MNNEIYIIWNRDRFSRRLAETFGIENILDGEEQFALISKRPHIRGVVLLAEYRGDMKRYSELYGMEVLTTLRAQYRLLCPIVICSYLPFSVLSGKYAIFDFPQHHPFLPLPATAQEMAASVEGAVDADEPRLNDIIANYCDPGGRLIKLLTHGRLFVAIKKNEDSLLGEKSFRQTAENDLFLLKHYLNCGRFDHRIGETGQELISELEKAVGSASTDFDRITTLIETMLSRLCRVNSDHVKTSPQK
jgi:hypothetical protein